MEMDLDTLREKAERVMDNADVKLAMAFRCSLQGHSWSSTAVHYGGFPGPVQRYSYWRCEWCGERK
jgi:hypothetical protein